MLLDLAPEDAEQGLLFAQTPCDSERSNRLMDALDSINRIQGRGAVHYAGEGLGGALADAAEAEVGGQHDGVGGAAGGEVRQNEMGLA